MKLSNIRNMALATVMVASTTIGTTEVKAEPATVLAVAGAAMAGIVGYNYGTQNKKNAYDVQIVPSYGVSRTYSQVSMPMIKETVIVEKPVVVEKYVPVYIKQKQNPTVIFY